VCCSQSFSIGEQEQRKEVSAVLLQILTKTTDYGVVTRYRAPDKNWVGVPVLPWQWHLSEVQNHKMSARNALAAAKESEDMIFKSPHKMDGPVVDSGMGETRVELLYDIPICHWCKQDYAAGDVGQALVCERCWTNHNDADRASLMDPMDCPPVYDADPGL
jgi:hypothetical protein